MKIKAAFIVSVFLGLFGCEGFPSQVNEAKQSLNEARQALVEAEQERQALIEQGKATEAELEEAQKTIVKAEDFLEAAEQYLDLVEKAGEDGPNTIEAITTAVGTMTGHPEIILLGTTIAGFWRARRNRMVAENIVQSVEPAVRKADPQVRDQIAGMQTAAAKKVVDQAQGKRNSIGF